MKRNLLNMNEIQILDFDTKLFGFRVAKFTEKVLSSKIAEEIIIECKNMGIKCLYADLDINDFVSLSSAIKYGFVIADIRVIFEKDLTNFKNSKEVKGNSYKIDANIKKADLPYLLTLSKEIACVSRFAFDGNFPKGSSEKLYTTWMINSINGKAADRVFIAKEKETEKPIGVITCKEESDRGEIVLVGVDKEYFGRGIASSLINHALSFSKGNGFKKVRVVTQGNNIPAQRLYQKIGFSIYKISIFFHLWIE